jgi:hypothetical protein
MAHTSSPCAAPRERVVEIAAPGAETLSPSGGRPGAAESIKQTTQCRLHLLVRVADQPALALLSGPLRRT